MLGPAQLSVTNPDIDHAELVRSVEDFSNYPGFEVDDEAVNEFLAYDPSFLLVLDSWDEVVRNLGSEPILSRFGVLKRGREVASRRERCLTLKSPECNTEDAPCVLPRISDANADALEMMSHLEPGQEIDRLCGRVLECTSPSL